jgi:hypothetical protein
VSGPPIQSNSDKNSLFFKAIKIKKPLVIRQKNQQQEEGEIFSLVLVFFTCPITIFAP